MAKASLNSKARVLFFIGIGILRLPACGDLCNLTIFHPLSWEEAVKVKEIMYTKIYKLMDKEKIGSVLVEVKGELKGIMSERDILQKLVIKGGDPQTTTVGEIMSTPLITIDADADVDEASKFLAEYKIKRLVVVRKGDVVGIISSRGIEKNIRFVRATRFIDSFATGQYGTT